MWVRYKCNICTLDGRADVRARRDGEDIEQYLNDIMLVLMMLHTATGCRTRQLDLMLPVTDAGVGRGELPPDPGRFLEGETTKEKCADGIVEYSPAAVPTDDKRSDS